MRRNHRIFSALLFSALLLSGCGGRDSVTAAPAEVVPTVTPADSFSPAAEETAVFSSKDGVTIHWAAPETDAETCRLPVLDIAPHAITAEEARRAADALFGDGAVYFQHRPCRPVSKASITKKVMEWQAILGSDALETLYGDQPETVASARLELQRCIDETQTLYDAAPDTEQRAEYDWVFRPQEAYSSLSAYLPEGNDTVWADTLCGSLPYTFSATNRSRGDFYLNSIFAYPLTDDTAGLVEDSLFRFAHSYESRPTAEQIESAKARAQELLDEFALGEWTVDRCGVKDRALDPEAPRYTIEVRAVPVYHGAAVQRQTQVSPLRDADGVGWYHATAAFEFGADNTLFHFELFSPADAAETEDRGTLSSADAASALQAALADKDLSSFFVSIGQRKQDVYIYEVRPYYRRVGGSDGQYRYVPCLAAMAAFADASVTGEPLTGDALYPLAAISLLDGSAV